MIVVFEGPEKAGKSSIISEVCSMLNDIHISTKVRKWGPVKPDDRVYTPFIKKDALSDTVIIWDRSWCSEAVYATILNRKRRANDDPWLMEWLHGRAATLKFMVLPSYKYVNGDRRDATDLVTDPMMEYMHFRDYALRYGWPILTNDFTQGSLQMNAHQVIGEIINQMAHPQWYFCPPQYVGPNNARVLFVGEKRNVWGHYPGGWLPFTSPTTMQYARNLGDANAMKFVWTNVGDIERKEVVGFDLVVACGNKAQDWVRACGPKTVIALPHPAWLYRYNNEKTRAAKLLVNQTLKSIGECYGKE
jgi:hypothetical protein